MTISPDQAYGLTQFLIADFERETPTTVRVLSHVPAGQEGYTPDPKSMHALRLAWHIASADVWFLNCISSGAFASGGSAIPESIKTAADVVAWYETNQPAAVAKVRAMTPEQCAKVIDFKGVMQASAVVFLQLAIKHSVHHRGQLSTYLRPMGAKVPGIYGPSGDA